MNAITNWAKGAALLCGVVGIFLLWKYGDALMETEVKREMVTPTKDERLARYGLGFLIVAIGLYLVSGFL